ncbi:BCCT family transporter [Alteromonas aestuariivivens]|uniref:BCCT family transporter n=1 Tax=Alteromonas aestuariivivens TaxID=1938339 RepID=UPI0015F27DFE|nr:choline BCCT transporter BetT [Alteromonas aestuariivivens]
MVNSKAKSQSLNKVVFATSSVLIVVLMLFAVTAPELAESLFQQIQDSIIDNGGWFYVLTVALILFAVVFLGVSRYGDIRLGPEHARPEFSMPSWISMLFAAGMGIGLMFFGVAEPIMHFVAPPTASPQTVEAVREAMATTFFHWGVHAWAIYAIVALILAYFSFRYQLPLTLRSALYPMIGERIHGWPGHVVDIFAVTSTIFGVSTSLGFGASQINAGLNYLMGVPSTTGVQIVIMAVVVGLAIISVVTGLDKGIRRLSETNMVLAIALLVFIIALGPTVFLVQAYLQNTGAYLSEIVRKTLYLFAYERTEWIGGWTIFYWGWWLAWAPFVGLFIARISYGRTIREFVVGVLCIPTAFTLLWMTVFGNSAIDMVFNQGFTELATMVEQDTSVALFVFLQHFPFSSVLIVLALLMVMVFFVTSCDSGAMVVDMLCSHGNNNTPVWQRIYWALGVGIVASVLLYAGGLQALQTMTIAAALPFGIILLISMYGLFKALKVETYKRESLQTTIVPLPASRHKEDWQERLHAILHRPHKPAVSNHLENTIKPALKEVTKEFENQNFDTVIDESHQHIELKVILGVELNFVYGVYLTESSHPEILPTEQETVDSSENQTYYRAEVHLSEGGQNYDIMGWSRLGIINDVIEQFYKHQHFLHLLTE